jgi:adrenodoxin-NADP+ reductase
MKLSSVAFHPLEEALMPDIKSLPRVPRRIMEVLKKGSPTPSASAEKSWSLDFCLSPTSFNSHSRNRLTSISFEKTTLGHDLHDPAARASGTGKFLELPASAAFRSIGYKSEALPGFSELGIPFNERLGIIANDDLGRVVDGAKEVPTGHRPALYCAGWVKRGPTGVIASTMMDAFSTADAITQDWAAKASIFAADHSTGSGWEGVKKEAEARNCRRVSWRDWQKIDAMEKSKGRSKGKEREKFTKVEDMLAVID